MGQQRTHVSGPGESSKRNVHSTNECVSHGSLKKRDTVGISRQPRSRRQQNRAAAHPSTCGETVALADRRLSRLSSAVSTRITRAAVLGFVCEKPVRVRKGGGERCMCAHACVCVCHSVRYKEIHKLG
jgi:hypothetical protein